MAFLLHFKDDGKKMPIIFFEIFFTRSDVLYSHTIILHFNFKSVSFQMVSGICISLLQGLSYRQLDLGMQFQAKMYKRGGSLRGLTSVIERLKVCLKVLTKS